MPIRQLPCPVGARRECFQIEQAIIARTFESANETALCLSLTPLSLIANSTLVFANDCCVFSVLLEHKAIGPDDLTLEG